MHLAIFKTLVYWHNLLVGWMQLCAEEWLRKLNKGTELHTVQIDSHACIAELQACVQSGKPVLLKVMSFLCPSSQIYSKDDR